MITFQARHTQLATVVTDVVPSGVAYSVTAESGGVDWLVAEGVGIGAAVAVSDPAAPVDEPVTYTTRVGSTVKSRPGVRAHRDDDTIDTILTSEDGRISVPVLWEGDAAVTIDPRATYAYPLASRFAVQHRALSSTAPAWSFEFRVDIDQVADARRLLETGRFWVLHIPERCDGGSTIPRVMLAGVDGTISESRWPLGRTYSVKLQQLQAQQTGLPVTAWGDPVRRVWSATTTFAGMRRKVRGA
ncbi:hypothetical protein [Pseudoclavibacter sp. AY1H1]|uniref:hypothetical protein n=1 Tax=Pseudoclavibacter sp. AY1H1 TaxID=2080584 RepID=UPI000CE8E31C|nr:hypothetical protein [Pseudoclavibacter sp. AY1H1]PPF39979.1 hypothetical protein C5E05_01840 [Pseudoclavibacter sp. AY1H1]